MTITVSSLRGAIGKKRRYAQAIEVWEAAPAELREERVGRLLNKGAPNAPAWFLIGCARLRAYRVKEAGRAFGMAHHADCGIQSAALLTFACLKAGDGETSDIIDQIAETWHELQCPKIAATWQDRMLLEALKTTTRHPPDLSALGQLVWLVVGPAHQARMEQSLDDPTRNWAALRA